MPIAASASISGRVSASPDVAPGVLLAPMELQGTEGLIEGTVSRSFIDSIDGLSIYYGFRVKLDNEWLPDEDLVGPFEVEEDVDSHLRQFSFGLAGYAYGLAATARTWTRTPVEVWVRSGKPGAIREWCRAAGYVLSCEQPNGHEPVVRVSCGDDSILFDSFELCHEIPPGSGLTRGAILAELAADAGISAIDVPSGAVYQKPFQAISSRLFEVFKAFGEPEGWSWRWRPEDRVLEAYSANLRAAPEPPDHVWTYDDGDFVSIDSTPARDVPSRWIVRGTAMVIVDEGDITRTVTRTVVEETYAPKVCEDQQNPDGSVTPTGAAPETPALRVTSIIEDEQRQLGSRLVDQVTRESGWSNPAAAKFRTPNASEGDGPVEDGYHRCQAFIDPEGKLRVWIREAFIQLGERRQRPRYDLAGTPIGGTTQTFRWYRKTMGVRTVGSASLNVIGAGVGDDDQSYLVFGVTLTSVNRIEELGLQQSDDVTYEYQDGAALREIQETQSYRSIRTAIAAVPWYELYDGTGQMHLVADWGLSRRRTLLNLLSADKHLLGKIESEEGYSAPRKVGGIYDWGDFRSNRQAEAFELLKRTLTQFNTLDGDRHEEIVEDEDGRRPARIIQGRLPLPRFATSVWTALAQAPLELILDDPTAEAWFGFSREVLDSEFVQNLEEAQKVIRRRRARAFAHQHQVVRPRTQARPGDTVYLIDPRSGIHARCLVARLRESWTLAPRTSVMSTYALEQPL